MEILKRVLIVALPLVLAICLSILPLPEWANWLRPAWVALVLCYWVMVMPQSVGLGMAWVLGLLLDGLNDTVLGEHALALTIVAYMITKASRQLPHYPLWQQGVFILFCLLCYHFSLFMVQWMVGLAIIDWRFWLSPLISALLWPCVFILMARYQQRFSLGNSQ